VFQLVADAVVQKIGSIMMLPIEDVTLDKPLADIGLDSLVAVEFRNWMVKELGLRSLYWILSIVGLWGT